MTLKEQYKHELELLKGRIHKLKGRGYIYDYSITEHKKPTISTIRYIRSLRGEKLTQGVHSKNIDINVLAVGKENVPTRAEQKEAGLSLNEYDKMLQSGVKAYEIKDITENRALFKEINDAISEPLAEEQQVITPSVTTSIKPIDLSQFTDIESTPLEQITESALEQGVYYENTYSGELLAPDDDRIYMHDSKGRHILDENGNKILKNSMVLKTNKTLSREAYQELLWDSVVQRFSQYSKSKIANSFVEWLNERKQEFGVFKVIEALNEYEKEGVMKLNYNFFYKASEADLSVVRNAMYQTLLKYEKKQLTNDERNEIINTMDDLERYESWEEPD